MSALSQEDIQNALRSVVDPVTGKDLFSGGQIAGLVIKNRNVGFAIEIDPADAERMEPLRKAAERAVMALNGGEMVSAADSAFGMSGTMCAIWFGILVVKMAEFCLITPPIGLNCFVVAGVRDDLSVQDVFKGVMPFFLADAVTIALLVSFPSIVLWLPSLAS